MPKLPKVKISVPSFSLNLKRLKFKLPDIKLPRPYVRGIFSQASSGVKVFTLGILRSGIKIKFPKISGGLLLKAGIISTMLIGIGIFSFWFYILKDLPSPKTLTTRKIDVSTKIYDRNGVLLYQIFKDKNRTIIPLSDIPKHVQLATLAAEDAEFYDHPGFSIRGITRSVFRNLEKGELTGGSTITQQLVKNALLTTEKTFIRKTKEVTLAVQVEFTFSKDEILEMYLNEVSYGGTAYGIEAGSQAYFGKSVKDLNLAEAAFLAGLPKSPSRFSPFSGNFESGINRQKDILHLMKVNKFISEEDEEKYLAYELKFSPDKTDIKAPHFVMYVRQLLAEKYGEDVVETGGLEVMTTLDLSIQKFAEETLKKEIEGLKKMDVGNGSVVILDPKTGEILAMVGSHDYFDIENDGNVNVAIRGRSPGSSIKIVNYAYALSNNYTPASIIDDSPISFKIPGQANYTPKNYDGGFHGKVSLRSAFAQSLNIPAVKILAGYGVGNMIDLGRKMGVTTWEDKSKYGISLTLGGGDVKLLDLAQVYATVANSGERKDIMQIKKVTDYKGRVLEESRCSQDNKELCTGEQVLDRRVSYLLTDILKDNVARSPSFGRNSQLVIPNHPEVAVKTGTSNDLRDNLTVGYTQNYVVAVWVGNNDNSPMNRIASGLTGASTIFNKIMSGILAEEKSIAWEVPTGVVQMPVCSITGTLPCDGCPTKREFFLEEKRPALSCRPDQILALEEQRNRNQLNNPFRPQEFN